MASDEQYDEADMVCRMETFTKSFSLNVIGYSLIKELKPEPDMIVGTFNLGEHKWGVKFTPHAHKEWLSLCLFVMSNTKTMMSLKIEYSLFDHKIGAYSTSGINAAESNGKILKDGNWILRDYFMKTLQFEESDYLKDDSFMLKCYVSLVKPTYVDSLKKGVVVPSSEFLQHFQQLWKSKEGTDVAFLVGEETFSAHRTVVAARSPVFRAEFFGQMQESKDECVRIIDIKPEVFELLLDFVYTDTLSPNDQELSFEMTQHLLVAADRYGLGRLKLISEKKLGDCIDVKKAVAILMLADQYNCGQLKEICLDFVASDENLQAVMATDSFKHLIENCPPLLANMLEKVDSKRATS